MRSTSNTRKKSSARLHRLTLDIPRLARRFQRYRFPLDFMLGTLPREHDGSGGTETEFHLTNIFPTRDVAIQAAFGARGTR